MLMSGPRWADQKVESMVGEATEDGSILVGRLNGVLGTKGPADARKLAVDDILYKI